MFKLITTTALTIALTATSASAQDTRAEEIARAQDGSRWKLVGFDRLPDAATGPNSGTR